MLRRFTVHHHWVRTASPQFCTKSSVQPLICGSQSQGSIDRHPLDGWAREEGQLAFQILYKYENSSVCADPSLAGPTGLDTAAAVVTAPPVIVAVCDAAHAAVVDPTAAVVGVPAGVAAVMVGTTIRPPSVCATLLRYRPRLHVVPLPRVIFDPATAGTPPWHTPAFPASAFLTSALLTAPLPSPRC